MTAPNAIVVVPADSWEAVIAALERAVNRLERGYSDPDAPEYDPLTSRAIEAVRAALTSARLHAYRIAWEPQI